jgi:hypothetical protein
MKMTFIQTHKVVNGKPPVGADHATANITDVVSLKNYRHATFVILTGASADNVSTFAVVAGTTVGGAVNKTVPFKYSKCVTGDTFGALTDVAAGSSVALTASTADQMIVIEVDAQEVETAHPGYDCIALKYTQGNTHASINLAIAVIMSEPRYANDAMPSAIID